MKHEYIIEFVGGAEEDVAYLRLLLRKAARKLTHKWRMRAEDDRRVDLLVIEDIDSSAVRTESARRRMRLIDPALGAAGMETVPWPVAQEILVRLLNLPRGPAQAPGAVPAAPAPAAIAAPSVLAPAPAPASGGLLIQHNIYDDLFEPEPEDRLQDHHVVGQVDFTGEWLVSARAHETALMHEAESFFRHDSRNDHVEALRRIQLHPDVDVEATEGHTEGSGWRKDRRGPIEPVVGTPHALSAVEAVARYPLASYLGGRLLPGPAQVEAAQVVLVLDPRHRMYYARGGLQLFEDICKLSIPRADWRALSASDFATVKAQLAPRPYSELQWLCAYFDEQAATEPDDILRYRLLQNIDVQRDYPMAARVAEQLMRGSSLKAAAVAAQVSLAEAKRVAAAFDAAGLLVPD